MTFPPVLAMSVLVNIVAVLFTLISIVLILVILIQKGRGGGLSGAFGGGMASGLLGSKTGDFLTWVTIVVVGVFLTFAVLLAKFYRPTISEFGAETSTTTQQPAPTTEQPTTPAPPGATTAPAITPTEQAPAQPPAEPPGATTPAPAPAPMGGADANGGAK